MFDKLTFYQYLLRANLEQTTNEQEFRSESIISEFAVNSQTASKESISAIKIETKY